MSRGLIKCDADKSVGDDARSLSAYMKTLGWVGGPLRPGWVVQRSFGRGLGGRLVHVVVSNTSWFPILTANCAVRMGHPQLCRVRVRHPPRRLCRRRLTSLACAEGYISSECSQPHKDANLLFRPGGRFSAAMCRRYLWSFCESNASYRLRDRQNRWSDLSPVRSAHSYEEASRGVIRFSLYVLCL